MIRVCLSLIAILTGILFVGWKYHGYTISKKDIFLQKQSKKIQELKKEILAKKNKSEIECFEKSIYNRKRFLEKGSYEESDIDTIDYNSTIVF